MYVYTGSMLAGRIIARGSRRLLASSSTSSSSVLKVQGVGYLSASSSACRRSFLSRSVCSGKAEHGDDALEKQRKMMEKEQEEVFMDRGKEVPVSQQVYDRYVTNHTKLPIYR